MATLKSLLAERTTNKSLDFRLNEKPAADGTIWANAWVTANNGKLLCIGATLQTIETMQKEGNSFDKLILTQAEDKIAKESGLEYSMCQLAIAKIDFSFSLE